MNDFDEAFEMIGGILVAITLLLILLTWLESSLRTDPDPQTPTSGGHVDVDQHQDGDEGNSA